jgi:hypothetical protein
MTHLNCCPRPIGYLEIGSAIIPLSCNRWDCVYCGRIKKWLLAEKVGLLFEGVNTVKQLTITQKLGSKRNIMKDWETMRKILIRAGLKIEKYVWFKEFTYKGQRHLHILLDIPDYVNQKWLSDIWRKVTKGESFRVWINETDIQKAAAYAMAYLTKSYQGEYRYARHERRVGFSRGARNYEYPYTPILGNFWEIIGDLDIPVNVVIEYHADDYTRLQDRSYVRDDEAERGLNPIKIHM